MHLTFISKMFNFIRTMGEKILNYLWLPDLYEKSDRTKNLGRTNHDVHLRVFRAISEIFEKSIKIRRAQKLKISRADQLKES